MEDNNALSQSDAGALDECRSSYGAYLPGDSAEHPRQRGRRRGCAENDVYLAAWNAIPPERPVSLRAFLGKIARNLALGRRERDSAQSAEGARSTPCSTSSRSASARRAEVSERAEAAELAAAVDAFLRRRGERERRIFLRRVFFCDPISDIARRFGISEAAVSPRSAARAPRSGAA